MKVLVVDDAEIIRINMRKALEKKGFEVIEAESGFEAIMLYKERRPDVVYMDICMENIDGLTALREIKAIDENAKVIMITGSGSQKNFAESLKNGASYFLVKPLDLDRIVEVAIELVN